MKKNTNEIDAIDLGYVKGCFINDHTRGKIEQLDELSWIWNELTKSIEYCLVFKSGPFTHYLPLQELIEIYPCIGSNKDTIEILYRSNK